MTSKQKVLDRDATAFCAREEFCFCVRGFNGLLGTGMTPREAWSDAAQPLRDGLA